MKLLSIKCSLCKKIILRSPGRINEAKKFAWRSYCSIRCMALSRFASVELQCSNPGCGNKFFRLPKEIKKVNRSFCSQSCAARVNNKERVAKHVLEPRICANNACKARTKGERKYCSRDCISLMRTKFSPATLIEKLQNAAQELERAPTKRELTYIADMCVRAFGSWNNAILAAGLLPHRSHSNRMYRRLNAIAKDGHKCDSISEAIIDNWLTKNKIAHERNVFYPKTNHRADWLIAGDVFVEYFGLARDSTRYDHSVEEKIKLCKKYKIKLVKIYPHDLYPKEHMGKNLTKKLSPYLN